MEVRGRAGNVSVASLSVVALLASVAAPGAAPALAVPEVKTPMPASAATMVTVSAVDSAAIRP